LAEIRDNKQVYDDESGVHKEFQREYGYAVRGEVVWDTKSGKGSLGLNVIGGLCNGKHIAVEYYEHTTDAVFFEQ
jgi:hypothetical protein